MKQRTIEQCKAELNEAFPWLNSRWKYLIRALQRLDEVEPEKRRRTLVFKMHFGLEHVPTTIPDIAAKFGVSRTTIMNMRDKIKRLLNHQRWRDETTWPEPLAVVAHSTMTPKRVAEIAVKLQMLQYQSVGTRLYMSTLQSAAIELKIIDEEMRQFYLAIVDRLMGRRG